MDVGNRNAGGAVTHPMNPATADATSLSVQRAYVPQSAPPIESGAWLTTDLLIRSRIRQAHPDLTDDDVWDLLERG